MEKPTGSKLDPLCKRPGPSSIIVTTDLRRQVGSPSLVWSERRDLTYIYVVLKTASWGEAEAGSKSGSCHSNPGKRQWWQGSTEGQCKGGSQSGIKTRSSLNLEPTEFNGWMFQ